MRPLRGRSSLGRCEYCVPKYDDALPQFAYRLAVLVGWPRLALVCALGGFGEAGVGCKPVGNHRQPEPAFRHNTDSSKTTLDYSCRCSRSRWLQL